MLNHERRSHASAPLSSPPRRRVRADVPRPEPLPSPGPMAQVLDAPEPLTDLDHIALLPAAARADLHGGGIA